MGSFEPTPFLYTTFGALGQGFLLGGDLAKPDPLKHRVQVPRISPIGRVKPSAKGATQVDARAPSPDQEDAVYSQSLGDFIALDSSDLASPSQKGASAAKESPSNVGQGAAQPAVPTVASEAAAEAPWERASTRISSPMLRLHNEIGEFCRFLEPSEAERSSRQAAMDRVSRVVTAIFPSATVQVFGSFATGLFLPTSDMDLVITGSLCTDIVQGLKALAQALTRKEMVNNVQVVAKAKVPIIKFVEVESGISFDISFDIANGPVAAEYVRELMTKLPPMRPLLFIVKIFLQQRDMNEVYTGGIGSYALLVMVAAFLQTHPSRVASSSHSRSSGPLEGCLGVLLVDFFRLYGRSLHAEQVGVSCKGSGSFFDKRSRGLFQYERPFLLSVEDPKDTDNDLGRNSFNATRVRQAFDYAYKQLTQGSIDEDERLLQRVIRLDAILVDRPRPAVLPDYGTQPPASNRDSYDGEVEAVASKTEADDAKETKREKRRRQETEKKRNKKSPSGKKQEV